MIRPLLHIVQYLLVLLLSNVAFTTTLINNVSANINSVSSAAIVHELSSSSNDRVDAAVPTTRYVRGLQQTQQPYEIRISAGTNQSWVDRGGNIWMMDQYFNKITNSAIFSSCPMNITGTDLDPLYCKERYIKRSTNISTSSLRYNIPVPRNGNYTVKLHFAETFHKKTGLRTFNVWVGGSLILRGFDIFGNAGYATALIIPVVTKTMNQRVVIELVPQRGSPMICAIEVIEALPLPAPVATPTMAPIIPLHDTPFESRISAGTNESWVDRKGVVWGSDKYYGNSGEIHMFCPLKINGTNLDELYCKERYFNQWKFSVPFRYDIPIPRNGYYSVKLHFAEIFHTSQGQRVFDVIVNGKLIFGYLDIFAEVGFQTAFVIPLITQTSSGYVSIEFKPRVEYPKISAIEVVELPHYVPPPTAAPVAKPFEILINSGAIEEFIERDGGRKWLPDQYFIGGGVLFRRHYNIEWTLNDEVYYLERNGEFRYEIPVPMGTYDVILHLAELHWELPGQRKFDITIEEDVTFKNIDLIKYTGGIRRSFTLQHTLPITDGLVSLAFLNSIPQVDMPKLSGVEIRFVSSSTVEVKAFPLYINCGGSEFTDGQSGISWKADRHYIVGYSYLNGDTRMTDTQKNKMYHSSRYRDFRYEIPAVDGTYDITLHFAEAYYTKVGERVFNIEVEDVLVFQKVDLIKMGNGTIFKPLSLKTRATVTDGLLSIAFSNDATVNGIEIKFVRSPIKSPVKPLTRTPTMAPVRGPVRAPVPAIAPYTCTIPRLNGTSWSTPSAPYPITVAEPSGDMIGNDFIIFGGFKNGYTNATTETYALDLSTPMAQWRRMDDAPFPNGLTHQGLVVVGTKAYLCGGYVGGSLGRHADNCFIYDHSKPARSGKQWSSFASLPMGGRSGGGMIYDTALNAIIYTGGSQRDVPGKPGAIDFKNTWIYFVSNPSGGWIPRSDTPFYANHMNSITVNDGSGKERHYIFGGQVGDFELFGNVATMYEYVVASDTWIKRSPMPYGRGHSASSVRAFGCGFLVAGGRTNKGLTGEISYYSTAQDSWQTIGRLPADIHTNVCVVTKKGMLRCEAGWATSPFSVETPIQL